MFSRSFAAALIFTTGTAAAGGSYLAMRQGSAEAVQAAPAPVPAPAVPLSIETTPPAAAPAPLAPQPEVVVPEAPRAVRPARRSPRVVEPTRPAATRSVAVESVPVPAAVSSEAPARVEQPAPEGAALPAAVTPLPAAEPVPEREPLVYEIVIPASAVIGLEIENTVSSEGAQVEDRVDARVTRDVYADERLAIPAGSRVIGAVTAVERGGKLKDRARLGVRFHTVVLPGGRQLPIRTEAIYREGDSPGAESTKKIGGAAIGGAVLGAILGGGKGAVAGAGVGAAGGTAVVMAGGRNAATLAGGSVVTVRLSAPVTVEVER
jgi:type IV secretory pathway VirB10-like protein